MAAVAETANTRRESLVGSLRMVKADLTSVDDTDTWTPGLAIIEHFDFRPTTAGAGSQWGATVTSPASRQGVVTFVIEGADDTLEGSAVAWGY